MHPIELVACLSFLAPQDGGGEGLWDRLSLYANGRLRGESTFDQPGGTDRHRGRLRLRVGAVYEILEGLTAEARLSTAADGRDANSPYWDFGDGADGFQGGDLVLDRFYLDWQALEELELRAGKMPNAFTSPPVYSEFTWDDDVQPAGVGAVWSAGGEGGPDFDLRLVDYVVQENGSDDDPNMLGVQGNLGLDLGEDTRLHLASGFQWWTSLQALGPGFGNQGNTTTAGMLDNDFSVWDSHLAATHDGGPLERQQAFVQYVTNVDDDSGQDQGWAAGVQVGRTSQPGDTAFFLAYYDFDANAFYSAVAQDDTPIPGTGLGTGMTGVLGGVRRVVHERLAVRLWGLTSDADAMDDPWRVRLDIDFKVN